MIIGPINSYEDFERCWIEQSVWKKSEYLELPNHFKYMVYESDKKEIYVNYHPSLEDAENDPNNTLHACVLSVNNFKKEYALLIKLS